MARSPAKKASKAKSAKKAARKPASKAAPARKAPARKAPARKAPARKAPARKVAAKKAPAKKALQSPAHQAKMADVRRRVARHRPGEGPLVNHEQQDPSIIPPPQPPVAPVDHLHGNYGDAKARSVARNDNPTNWFRQAPKAKSK